MPGLDLMREIGRGGMGVVYLARQRSLDRLVAVKLLQPLAGFDQELVERFEREARAAAVFDAAIVPVHDVGEVGGRHYLVMAYMPGGNLGQAIERRRLTAAEVMLVGRQIGGALATAHASGVVHRDVKPSNILLDARGHPFLGDFGVAQLAGDTRLTQAGVLVGTADYLAPELAEGHPQCPATDIYALGATLYECAAGRPPFGAPNAQMAVYQHRERPVPPLPDDVPRELAGVIVRALAKDPRERFPDAPSLVSALAELPGAGQAAAINLQMTPPADRPRAAPAETQVGERVHHEVPAGPPSRSGWLRGPLRRTAALALAAVLAGVVIVAGVIGGERLGVSRLIGALQGSHTTPAASTSPKTRSATSPQPGTPVGNGGGTSQPAPGGGGTRPPSTGATAGSAPPPVTFSNTQVAGVGACCFAELGPWNQGTQGGYPHFGGSIVWTTSSGSVATWSLGPTSGGRRWDQVRVQVWIPNHMAGAWVRYTVTASASGGASRTGTVDVPQQANQGLYTLGTFAAGTTTRRTGSITVRMTYLRPYTGPAADSTCVPHGCTEMAAAQVLFAWS